MKGDFKSIEPISDVVTFCFSSISITISKSANCILIQSTEGQQIEINDNNKELKASDVIDFLKYSNSKKYELTPLQEDEKSDKNVISVYEIFNEIIEKINPTDN